MLAVAVHVGGALSSGVAVGVAAAEVDAIGPDGGGVVIGVGLVAGPAGDGTVLGDGLAADAQAATSRPTTIVFAKRESEQPI